MVTIVKRVVGAVLSLMGLGLVVVGAWFATQLGSSGTAEFTLNVRNFDPAVRERVLGSPRRIIAAEADASGVLAQMLGVPSVYWMFGSFNPDRLAGGNVAGNHSPEFAPDVDPTLMTGVRAALTALLSKLGHGASWPRRGKRVSAAWLHVPDTRFLMSSPAPMRCLNVQER